jgi:succinoglycan biosynthesis transport protein ExoP
MEAKRAMREIEERYQAAAAAESGYEQLVAERRTDAEHLDKLYAEYAPLVRDQKFAEDEYTKLSGRLGTSRQEGQNSMINVEPHELARQAYKVLPRMNVNVAIAAFLSLMLGIGLVFLLDHMDRTIKSAEGIEALVGSPLLGIIPVVADVPTGDTAVAMRERDLYLFKHPTSQAAECCRSIRTNILFSSTEREVKTITVTSARPREGKSTTTIYLGTTMAQSGQRVLLVDTDLRRPRLHKSLGVSKERGLTTLLLGESNYDDVVKTTDVPNLFVLPCGPLPPNPAELLLTKRFKVVLDELATRFDRILLDSPPILAVTDAVLLSRVTDGIILVAQAGKTHTEDVTLAVRQLRDVDAPVLGVILNVIDISGRRYGGYYYAYGGYGDNANAEAS